MRSSTIARSALLSRSTARAAIFLRTTRLPSQHSVLAPRSPFVSSSFPAIRNFQTSATLCKDSPSPGQSEQSPPTPESSGPGPSNSESGAQDNGSGSVSGNAGEEPGTATGPWSKVVKKSRPFMSMSPYGSASRRAMRGKKQQQQAAAEGDKESEGTRGEEGVSSQKPSKFPLPNWFSEHNILRLESLKEMAAGEQNVQIVDYPIDAPKDKGTETAAPDGQTSTEKTKQSQYQSPGASSSPPVSGEPTEPAASGTTSEQQSVTTPNETSTETKASEFSPSNPDSDNQQSTSDRSTAVKTDEKKTNARYTLHSSLYNEMHASVRVGLRMPLSEHFNDPSSFTSTFLLRFPGENGLSFLDSVTRHLAADIEADLINVDADDIAQLYADASQKTNINGGESDSTARSPSAAWLGYNVSHSSQSKSATANSEASELDEEDEYEDDEEPERFSRKDMTIKFPGLGVVKLPPPHMLADNMVEVREPSADAKASSTHSIMTRVVESIFREWSKPAPDGSKCKRDLIVQVRNYENIRSVREGNVFITVLRNYVAKQRARGKGVVILGTASLPRSQKETASTSNSTPSAQPPPSREDGFHRTISILPAMDAKATRETLKDDRCASIRDKNLRHLQNMLKSSGNRLNLGSLQDSPLQLPDEIVKKFGVGDSIWSFDQVHRVATVALGFTEKDGGLTVDHISRAIDLIASGDRYRDKLLTGLSTPPTTLTKDAKGNQTGADPERDARMKALHESCNTYEQRFFSGIVDSKNIKTTFEDIHAAQSTKDSLRTLTSLSLARPDAFTYGVLATDKIPGLLLYGPPGTGKTMLAKGVAKQSGATVLEVSGADVNEMWVGEGEKNVKAIFSLARKLSPCIVFIDEADAIFRSRVSAGESHGTHRELINQFLREWDGLNNDLSNAFIMVATNRPFDLDDAVLRRLPRRLMVDLPSEKDRFEILRLHLRGENLDSSVDLSAVAKRTPLFSGSDLKNVCVAAALSCVKEENDVADRKKAETKPEAEAKTESGDPTGNNQSKFPDRRTLRATHFEQALLEIGASISEDMATLVEIRKFEERYGDARSRKKRIRHWGFAADEKSTNN